MICLIRIGEVSKVNMSDGTVQVLYDDREDEVTGDLTCLEAAGMPKVGDIVAVIHMDETGTEEGICLGRIYNEDNPPK